MKPPRSSARSPDTDQEKAAGTLHFIYRGGKVHPYAGRCRRSRDLPLRWRWISARMQRLALIYESAQSVSELAEPARAGSW